MAKQRRRITTEAASTDNDPVLALYRNYFAAARRLHEMVQEARTASSASFGDERETHLTRLETLLPLWLSALFTSCEGLRKVGGQTGALDDQMRELEEPLRRVWQHTVEYHDDAAQRAGRASFYTRTPDHLRKAEALHAAVEEFFRRHVRSLEGSQPDDVGLH